MSIIYGKKLPELIILVCVPIGTTGDKLVTSDPVITLVFDSVKLHANWSQTGGQLVICSQLVTVTVLACWDVCVCAICLCHGRTPF